MLAARAGNDRSVDADEFEEVRSLQTDQGTWPEDKDVADTEEVREIRVDVLEPFCLFALNRSISAVSDAVGAFGRLRHVSMVA